jgi:hypothetical protein
MMSSAPSSVVPLAPPAYLRLRHRMVVSFVLLLTFLVLMLPCFILFGQLNQWWSDLICYFVLIGSVVMCIVSRVAKYQLETWRCPGCGEVFGFSPVGAGSLHSCENCGAAFETRAGL